MEWRHLPVVCTVYYLTPVFGLFGRPYLFFARIIYLFPSALVSDIWAMYLDRIQNTGRRIAGRRNTLALSVFLIRPQPGHSRQFQRWYLAPSNQDLSGIWNSGNRGWERAQLLESGEGDDSTAQSAVQRIPPMTPD